MRADAHGLYPDLDPTEPMPLTDFRYLSRTFFDYNGNAVLTAAFIFASFS